MAAGKLSIPLQAQLDQALIELEQAEKRRGYIGASIIGDECERAIWFGFRWVDRQVFLGRILRRFETGHVYEARIIEELRGAGYEVRDTNPRARNPKGQYRAEMFGGALSGGVDGFVRDERPGRILMSDDWHLLEVKAMVSAKYHYADDDADYETPLQNKHPIKHPTRYGNESNIEGRWWKLKRRGVKADQPAHYTQLQAYMGLSHEVRPASPAKCKTCKGTGQIEIDDTSVLCSDCEGYGKLPAKLWHEVWGLPAPLKRALYIAVNTDTEQIHAEIVEFEPKWWKAIKGRAQRILRATAPPVRAYENPLEFTCKFCDWHDVCHLGKAYAKNCRTCVHADLMLPGDKGNFSNRAIWSCRKHKTQCPEDFTACEHHSPVYDDPFAGFPDEEPF